jgi:Kef-type K+ transport system membrane component KefB
MSFATLALLVAVGLAGPLLAGIPRFGPPLVVGEILAGIVIGRSGFDLVDVDDPSLTLLSEIGFALLMLIVGTHLPIRQPTLRPALRKASLVSLAVAAMALAVGYGLDPITGLHRPLVLAVLVATSSGAVALPVLQALPGTDDALLVTTAWIAIADVGTVMAIPLVIRQGSLGGVLLGIVGVLVVSGLVFVAALRVRGAGSTRLVRSRSRRSHWALDLRISLIILFLLAAIAVRQHTSVLIAGFAAGTVLALLGEPRRLAEQLIGLGEGFLVPLFFVALGAKLELRALFTQPRNLILAAVIAIGATAVHVLAARAFSLPIGAGLLATAQLGVPSAIANIGLTTGALTSGQAAAVLAAVLLSLVACAGGAALMGHPAPIGDYTAPLAGNGDIPPAAPPPPPPPPVIMHG